MKTKLLCFALVLLATGGSLFAQGQPQNVKGSFGAGPPGSSTPCTKAGDEYTDISASQQYVATAISQTSNSTSCTWTVSGSGSGSTVPGSPISFGATVSPLAYGAKWDVKYAYDVVYTSGSNTLTCPDCSFTAADQGKIAFGEKGPGNSNQGTALFADIIAQGTICLNGFISATSVKTCTADGVTPNNAAASCTPGSTTTFIICTFAWGTQDDTAAINAAMVAAWQTAGKCLALELPSGSAFFSAQILYTSMSQLSNTCGGQATSGNIGGGMDSGQTGAEVYGQGPGNSQLIPLPNFTWASCTGGDNANTCVGGTPNLEAHDFGINGLSQSVNSAHTVTLFTLQGSSQAFCTGSTGFNLTFADWAVQSTGSIGLEMGRTACGDPTYTNIVAEMFGATNCDITGGTVTLLTGVACFGAVTQPAFVHVAGNSGTNAGAVVDSNGGYFGEMMNPGPLMTVQNNTGTAGGSFNSKGDTFISNYSTAGSTGIQIRGNSGNVPTDVNIDGSTIGIASGNTGSSQVFFFSSTGGGGQGSFHIKNTVIIASGGNNRLIGATAASSWFDQQGGNRITNGGAANTAPTLWTGATLDAISTACATGNFALTSGWGTSAVASVAANGTILGCHVNVTGAAGSASPVLTWTYPVAPTVAPGSCHLSGASGTLTGVTTGTPGATTVAFTFTGTPSAQSYSFDAGCP